MALSSGETFGPYRIVALLGAGGMGEVYRAHDARLRRDVAIKVLPHSLTHDADRLARFEREAQLLAALNHPHIAGIYGLEDSGHARGLVLELIEGPTLAERIGGRPLTVDQALAIARQIVDALDAAHERGIVHRDLKPANIKVTPDGTVKVLDFSLAKDVGDTSAPDLSQSPTITSDGTRAGVILGTAPYMSPEQARGMTVDKRTDIWAFGCVLYEMLTGTRAFRGDTVSDVIAAIIGSEPDWQRLPAGTPPLVRRLLPRLLAKDLKRRVRDIMDARVDLEAADVAVPTLPSTRRIWPLAAAAALAAVAVAGVVGSGWLNRRAADATFVNRAEVSRLTNHDGSEASGAIAPDGRSFAFISEHGGSPDIWVRQIAGGEPVRLTNDEVTEVDVTFAADGEYVYFTKTEGGAPSIWRVLALGGQAQRVIGNAAAPSPSPDGRRLAWYRQEPSGDYTLLVSGIDGSEARILVSGVTLGPATLSVTWSPDGRRLAYSMGRLFTPRNLYIVEVDSARVRQATAFTGSAEGPYSQVWLPDNRHLAITYLASPGTLRARDLGIFDSDTGTITRLSSNLSDSFTGTPSLSSDGSRLLVTGTRSEREVWKVPFGPDPDANGRAATRILDASVDPMWTFVSRDGRTLLYNNAVVGSRNLWTMPIDSSARPRQITSIAGQSVMHSSLSPDGSRVAFASNPTGQTDIWVQNIDGSDLRRLTNDTGADAWPVWTPDGRSIVYSAQDATETRMVPAAGGVSEKIVDGFFRGDLVAKPGGGLLMATNQTGGGLRLIDVETRKVLWQTRPLGNAMPSFSPDGSLISHPYRERRDRDAIWLYETATGKSRVAVRFPESFLMFFRASWTDNGRAFIVNRTRDVSHIVMFDRFWKAE